MTIWPIAPPSLSRVHGRAPGLSSRHALTRLIRKHGIVIRKKPGA